LFEHIDARAAAFFAAMMIAMCHDFEL
jgi:hypothetical protein